MVFLQHEHNCKISFITIPALLSGVNQNFRLHTTGNTGIKAVKSVDSGVHKHFRQELFSSMLTFVAKASAIARTEQAKLQTDLKADASYVTNIDLTLSELAFKVLSRAISRDLIITEEHPDGLERFATGSDPSIPEFLVVIDPIDGTRNYVHQMPLYGVSVGVLRNLKPWIGAVAFPGLDEMVYFDGEELGLIQAVNTGGVPRVIRPGTNSSVQLDPNSIMLTSHTFVKHNSWLHNTCELSVIGCATINLCWPALGRGIGSIFGAAIWDLAGSWPILEAAGFKLWRLSSASSIDQLQWNDFDPDTMKLRQPVLACRPEHFGALSSSIVLGTAPG